jgi:hypothetical protein
MRMLQMEMMKLKQMGMLVKMDKAEHFSTVKAG